MKMLFRKQHPKLSRKREKQTRYLSQAIQLEEAVNSHIIRSTMSMISLVVIAFLIWAGFTNINEVARTSGEVVPAGYQQTVQHLEGGIIGGIHVKEGDLVEADQVLVSLHDASVSKDLERLLNKQRSLALKEERLRAFIDHRAPEFSTIEGLSPAMIADQQAVFDSMVEARSKEADVLRDQIAEKKQAHKAYRADLAIAQENRSIAKHIYDKRQQLHSKGYTSTLQLLEAEKNLNDLTGNVQRLENQILLSESEIGQFQSRLSSLDATQRDEAYDALSEVAAEQQQNIEMIGKLEERTARMQVRSPTQGMVKGLAVNTIGAVVQPGQTLMEIVPFDAGMEVQVKINPKDIGHIELGQPVEVKLSSYDFSRYGSVSGTLEHISATTFSGPQGERYYQGRLSLTQAHLDHNPELMIMPGMTVMADIITGEKTILQYLLKPIHLSLQTAFTER
ncbi:MAG: secretion protein HlyD [Rickettsiales bacterium]|nr:secretion protein HlyD [Rickettsiales bacterium]